MKSPVHLLECTVFMITVSTFYLWHPAAMHNSYSHLKSKVHPCRGRTAHGGSTGIPLLFLDHVTRRG